MRPRAEGQILCWEGASLWILRAPPGVTYPRTELHAHHAIQLTLALGGRVELEGDGGRLGGEAVAIAPDVPHTFQGTGLVAHLFVAPEGRAGRAMERALLAERPMTHVPGAALGDFPARLRATFEDPGHSDEALRTLGRGLIAQLAGGSDGAPAADRRIEKVIAWVAERLDQEIGLSDVATVAGLSAGRTRHLFVQQTGLPFRTYFLWLRLNRALDRFAGGASLTEAAHGAGFADSAHFSRTFKRMFGIVAASLRLS